MPISGRLFATEIFLEIPPFFFAEFKSINAVKVFVYLRPIYPSRKKYFEFGADELLYPIVW